MSAPLRIAIYGPESTGKSTLAAVLAGHFGEPWAPEFVRSFWEQRAGRIVGEDLGEIARGQIAAEDEAARRAKRVVFSDTELLTNVIWADLLFPGHCPEWVRAEAERRARGYALYLLCLTDIAFAPDPQRCFPDEAGRRMCMALWRERLTALGLPHVAIAGDEATRAQRAIEAVEQVLLSSK